MNKARGSTSAAALVELAGRVQPRFGSVWAAAMIGLWAPAALAGPEGSQVVRGNVSIQQNGANTIIHAGNNAIINHHRFNIGAGERVQFIQPGETSRVLNRITGPDPSHIRGTLTSNGIVYIANPAGVIFGAGSVVNVGGIYAAAGNITDSDFIANVNRFTGVVGAVENHGTIQGQAAHLIGAKVANFGAINAPGGMVTMTAGSEVYIGETHGNFFAKVSGPAAGAETGVVQAGEVRAPGGRVALGAGDMYAMAIDHRGYTQANEITLQGKTTPGAGGVVSVSGTLDASTATPGARGGTVKVLGEKIGVFDGKIDASGPAGGGTVLVGGNRKGQGEEPNADALYISENATISADSLARGDGGTIIVWSETVSRVFGRLSARGGETGGNGGFIETSSRNDLEVSRTPDVVAPRGRGGTWLIDPRNVEIVAGAGNTNINATNPFAPTGNDAQLGVDLLVAALTGGANVLVDSTGGGGQAGNITLTANLDYDSTGSNTLEFLAAGDIILNGSIADSTVGGDLLNLILTAGAASSITINNTVELNGGTFDASGLNFTLASTGSIDTADGDLTLDMTGSVFLGGDISTAAGTIDIDRPILLTDDVALTGLNILLSSTVNSSGAARNLAMTTGTGGGISLGGAIGGTLALGTLSTDPDAAVVLGAGSIAALDVEFDGAVLLTADTTITAANATFGSTVNSSGAARDLTVNTSGAGATTFAGAIGGTLALDALTTNADGTTLFGDTVTAASLAINDAATLDGGALTIGNAAVFAGAVTLGANTTITAGDVTFSSTVNSDGTARNLAVNTTGSGDTIFTGIVGGTSALGALSTNADGATTISAAVTAASVALADAAALNGGAVTTTGTQVYAGATTLGANTTLSASSATFSSTLNSSGIARDLSITAGSAAFSGAVGGTLALGALTTSAGVNASMTAPVTAASVLIGGTTTLGGTITTTGDQFYTGIVALSANSTVAGQNITFNSNINSTGSARNLTVNTSGGGVTTFTGAVGNVLALGALSTNADGSTLVSSSISAASVAFADAATLNGGAITTTGNQNYTGAVLLGANTTLTAQSLSFGSTVDSSGAARDLTLVTNVAGSATFIDDVGSGLALGDLHSSGGSTTFGGTVTSDSVITAAATISGGTITTTGNQNFNGAVLLGANTTLAGQNVTFSSTLNSTGSARNLNVNTSGGGLTTFGGAVGGVLGLGAVATNADGSTIIGSTFNGVSVNFADDVLLNGSTVTTSANQVWGGALTLAADATLSGGSITFSSTIDSSGSARDLTVNSASGGVTTFAGAVGSSSALDVLTTNADGSSIASSTIDAGSVSFGDTLTFSGGTITTSGDQSYSALLLAADTVLDGENVAVTGTTNSFGAARNLTVNSSSAGATTFGGAVGNTLALGALATNADGSTTLGGAVTAATVNLADAATISGGAVTTTGSQTYGGAVLLGANTTLAGAGVSFASTVDSSGSARNLTVNSTGATATTFTGAVGGTLALATLATNADGTTLLSAPVTAGAVVFGDALSIAGGAITTTGNQTYNNTVLLLADTTLTGNNITLNSTVDSSGGARDLTATVNNTATFAGAVGAGSALADLRAENGAAIFGSTVAANSLVATGTAAINGGAITTTTDQTYTGAATLGQNTTLVGRHITFSSTLDSTGAARNLAINTSSSGITSFGGIVGGTLALADITRNADGSTLIADSLTAQSLILSGPSTLGNTAGLSTLTTTGDQTYSGAVLLAGDTSIAAQNAIFSQTINSSGSARDFAVAASGVSTYGGALGNTLRLNDLNISGGTATFNGTVRSISATFGAPVVLNAASITTDFDQTFTGALTLNQNATVTGRALSFLSTIDSGGTARDLTVNSSSAGATSFAGAIGGTSALRVLTTNADGQTTVGGAINATTVTLNDAAALNGGSIVTTGAQSYGGAVQLGANTVLQGTSLSFASTIDSATARSLTLNTSAGGITTLGGAVGQSQAIGALVTNADGSTVAQGAITAASATFNDALQFSGGSVTTTGNQAYNQAVVLGADASFAGAEVRFNSTLDSTGAARDVQIATTGGGLVRFGGDVGAALALGDVAIASGGNALLIGSFDAASLDLQRSATISGGGVTTTGDQTYAGAVLLTADAQFQGAAIEFASTINSDATARNLDIIGSGPIRFGGDVGGSAALAQFTVGGGGLTIIDTPSILASSALFQNAVRLDQNLELATPGGADFASTLVSGGGIRRDLLISSGDVSFAGAVGSQGGGELGDVNAQGAAAINSGMLASTLTVGGQSTLAGTITTTGAQSYADAVLLTGDANLNASEIAFASTIDSSGAARALSLATTGGDVTFSGDVGASSALASLETLASSAIRIAASQITTTGAQSYDGAVVIVDSTTLSGSELSFASTVNAGATARDLAVVVSSGDATFGGAVGNTSALSSLTTSGAGRTVIGGGSVVTTGDQTYGTAAHLGQATTLAGNDITFQNTLDADAGAGLTVNTSGGGITTFAGDVGATSPLANLQTNADGTTRIGADINTQGGAIAFDDPALVFGHSAMTSLGGTGIFFNNTLDGEGAAQSLALFTDLDVNASANAPEMPQINFRDHVGNTTPLGSLVLGGNRSTAFIPTVPTIVAGLNADGTRISEDYSLIIRTSGDVTMGELQKFTVIGNLLIDAGGAVTLGDLTTLGDMIVQAPEIFIRTRPGSIILGAVAGGGGVIEDPEPDTGVDFVAGGAIDFSVTPTLIRTTPADVEIRPTFATPESQNISASLGEFLQRAFGTSINEVIHFEQHYMDLRSAGPTNANVAEAIAGAAPRESQSGQVSQDTAVGRSAREELTQLGVFARTLEERQLAEFLIGRALYNDVPETPEPEASDYRVTVNRLPSDIVARVLDSYRDVFFAEVVDPETGEVRMEPRPQQVSEAINAAWIEYSRQAGDAATVAGFRATLIESSWASEAVAKLDSLRELFTRLDQLGLTPIELRIARGTLLRAVTVPGISASEMEATILDPSRRTVNQ